jgi:hypothetical protein
LKSRFTLQLRLTLLIVSILATSLTGCRHSADVAGNGLLQKRKYRTGFHLQVKKQRTQASIPSTQKDTSNEGSVAISKNSDSPSLAGSSSTILDKHQSTTTFQEDQGAKLKKFGLKRAVRKKTKEESEDPFEPSISEKTKKQNKAKLLGSYISVVIPIIVAALFYILVATGATGTMVSLIGLTLPFFLMLFLVAATLSVFYLIEVIANSKNRTIFTPKFRKALGITSLILTILSAVLLIASGGILGFFFGALAASIDLSEAFVLVLVGGFLAVVFAALQYAILWPILTSMILSIRETLSGKIALFVEVAGWILGALAFIIVTIPIV